MANVDAPHGCRPLMRSLAGGEVAITKFSKPVTEDTAIFHGDPVAMAIDGVITPDRTPGTTLIVGVALNFGAAAKATEHDVLITPSAVFEAQDDEAVNGIQADELHEKTNLITGAGNVATGLSGAELDADVATTGTLDAQLLGKYASPDNEIGAGIGHVRCEFFINKHYYNPGATALGT